MATNHTIAGALRTLRAMLDEPVCKTCNGTRIVSDGALHCSSGGVPFENGPIDCVKDCPDCKPAARLQGEPVVCAHEWTDDGEFTLTCTKCGKTENHEPYGWVQTRGTAINLFTQEWDVVEFWEDQGFEYKAMFDHAKQPAPFQSRVKPWMLECFGKKIAADRQERNHRFLEEALELVQACGATCSEALQLVGYVYGRPVGEPSQEVGGVMVTLAALCLAHDMDMHAAGEVELNRIWTKVDLIRAKQEAKPAMSPLPGAYPEREQPAPVAVVLPERSPKDYAIEHAEYMAKSADNVLAKFQAYGLALLAVDEGGDDGEGELLENIDSTRSDLQEALVDLRSMVYEFRKRAAKSR